MKHVSASVVDSCIVDGSRGVSMFISACEGEDWPVEYRGVVTGHGNRIVVSEKALCPTPASGLWPDGLLDPEGS